MSRTRSVLKDLFNHLSAFLLKVYCNLLCFLSEPWHFQRSPVESCNDNHLALYMKVRTIKEGLGNIPKYAGICSWLYETGFSGQPCLNYFPVWTMPALSCLCPQTARLFLCECVSVHNFSGSKSKA